ncbi:MAG: hypothetical protein WCQ57_17255, partial [Verrucomicrobiota bacterium]
IEASGRTFFHNRLDRRCEVLEVQEIFFRGTGTEEIYRASSPRGVQGGPHNSLGFFRGETESVGI